MGSGRGAECPGSNSVSRSTWPKHRPPQLHRAAPAWSELHALESWASAQSSDPSQAGVGIPSTSPWCPWAPRCQLCGQLNGSSVPFVAPHPAPGSPGPPPWVGVPREDAHKAGSQEQEQQERRLLGSLAEWAPALGTEDPCQRPDLFSQWLLDHMRRQNCSVGDAAPVGF